MLKGISTPAKIGVVTQDQSNDKNKNKAILRPRIQVLGLLNDRWKKNLTISSAACRQGCQLR